MEKDYIMFTYFNTSYHIQQGLLRIKGERSLLTKKSMH